MSRRADTTAGGRSRINLSSAWRDGVPDASVADARPETFLARYRRRDAERVLQHQLPTMTRDAKNAGCSLRALQIQTLLHLPSPDCAEWRDPAAAYRSISTVALTRASNLAEYKRTIKDQADMFGVTPQMAITKQGIKSDDGRRIWPLEVREVQPSIGHMYQSKLHYLQSPRADAIYQFGLYQSGMTHPLLYLGFTACDREDVRAMLDHAGVPGPDSLVLARAVSVVNLPRNAFSFTLKRVERMLREDLPGHVLTTAINPYLGFTAASVLAAGFRPLFRRSVAYRYKDNGHFTTRRLLDRGGTSSRRRMPPNIIFSRDAAAMGPSSPSRTDLAAIPALPSDISSVGRAPLNGHDLYVAVSRLRKQLERAWSDKTLHPDFVGASRTSQAAGQCGVSSVFIAREIRRLYRPISVVYCYGDLRFDDPGIIDVFRHCWLEVGDGTAQDPLIIDATIDQAIGYQGRVLVERAAGLRKRGIRYIPRVRKAMDALPADAVWPRYLQLADDLNRSGKPL